MDKIETTIENIREITEKKIVWFRKRANICMYCFWSFSIFLGVSSTSLPLFALLEFQSGKNWIVAILSVITAFCSFMLQIGNYHLLWHNYRKSEFAMERLRQVTLSILQNLQIEEIKSSDKILEILFRFHAEYEEIEMVETNTYFGAIKSASDIDTKSKS
ncbi:MAG: DUF4231 domain-containing protein [Desulfamplus sp.]|nr:DUF4231 domain-containing protein [Desulfamplus sp.]